MSAPDRLDRRLTAWLEEQAPTREPDGLLDLVTREVARSRRIPAWAIPERWIPMTLSLRLAVVPRALLLLLLLSLLVAAVAAGGLVVGSFRHAIAPVPTGLAGNGLIAYSVAGDLWLMDEHGATRQLTSGPDLDYPAAWSPDGSTLAYRSVRYTGDPLDVSAARQAALVGGNVAIRLIGPEDREPRTLVSGLTWSASGESAVVWAPDGSALAYDHRGPAGAERIDVLPIEGGSPRTLAENGVTPAWSPDGSTIVFVTSRYRLDPDGAAGNGYGIRSVAADGGEAAPLSRARGDSGSFFWPQWSNDSRHVLFHTGDIHVAAADGAGEAAVTHSAELESHPRWSPANDHIAFLRRQATGDIALVITDRSGEDERRFDSLRLSGEPPVWSPDGRLVLVGTAGEDGRPDGLALLDVADAEPPIVVQIAGIDGIGGFGQRAWQRVAP